MVDAVKLHWIFSVPIGITISIFGLLGNLLSAIVWSRVLRSNYGGNKSTALYLVTLAVADSGLLLFFLFTDSLPMDQPQVTKTYSFVTFKSYVGFPFFFFFIVSSIWLVVAVTVNRFIMVMFPLKAKKWCSLTRAKLAIILTLSCCFLINIPHFYNFRPMEVNGTYTMAETDYAKSGGAARYEFWVHCMFLVLAPWAVVAFCNGGIIYTLIRRAKEATEKFHKVKDEKKGAGSNERQMTIMLLGVTFSFLVLLAWQCVTQCFYMLGIGKGGSQWNVIDSAFSAAKLGVVINSSINFLLYCCTGAAFRKEMMAFFWSKAKTISFTSSMRSTTRLTKDSSTMPKNSSLAESRA
uniref:Neuropeptide-like GPCR n=1 Tax=Tripedalia cystophora TaxID=6141 RepID=A0A4D5XX69_TRICY|nr:neuropeptide-like GPCR [Tripedalia cystophora]